ncbi:hypothetical protein CEXT_470631 [Caerostris extrusa]|uniref:Uncharacterized protein n=1 Tax=Caerostris extrusa TaxID=172846 RepID=A0AAV4T0A4_CAEEX|nr:hypothetical protein CEXT_470631 [Caerostris extrusa]
MIDRISGIESYFCVSSSPVKRNILNEKEKSETRCSERKEKCLPKNSAARYCWRFAFRPQKIVKMLFQQEVQCLRWLEVG